jgi:hypothetical protein
MHHVVQQIVTTMLIAATVYSLAEQGVGASPIPAIDQSTSSSCDDLHHCRTLLSIVRSCIVTVLSCTWIAIHPNIPGPDDSSLKIALRRVKLMVMALVAPELVVGWAMRQWCVARTLAKKHRSKFVSFALVPLESIADSEIF